MWCREFKFIFCFAVSFISLVLVTNLSSRYGKWIVFAFVLLFVTLTMLFYFKKYKQFLHQELRKCKSKLIFKNSWSKCWGISITRNFYLKLDLKTNFEVLFTTILFFCDQEKSFNIRHGGNIFLGWYTGRLKKLKMSSWNWTILAQLCLR